MEQKVQHFKTFKKAETAAKNVQHYLDEQEMNLEVQVEKVADNDFVVGIVYCY